MSKKRHHYIPQFYLKGFVDPENKPYIWVYDKEDGKIMRSSSKDIAVEKHYFSFINKMGKKDSETLENIISKAEAEEAPVIKKILEEELFSREDRGVFAFFVASMLVRAPNYRRNIEYFFTETMKRNEIIMASNEHAFKTMIKKFEKDTGKKIEMPIEDLRQFILKGEYNLSLASQVPMSLSMSNIEQLAAIFNDMNWIFFRAPENQKFLTGDNPLYYTDSKSDNRRGVGLLNKNIEVTLTLSKDLAAFGSWNPENIGYLNAEDRVLNIINKRTILASLRFVFASEKNEKLLQLVTTFRGSSPKMVIN